MISSDEQYVRNSSKKGILFFTDHAYEKMQRLKITKAMVINCLENGHLVEQQNGYENESPRLLFYNGHSNPFYIVIIVELPNSVVITVCETDFSKWDIEGDIIKRKEE